jgi:hypothetical protein
MNVSAESATAPDERAFRLAVGAADFLDGADRGRWRLLEINWPHALIAVEAAPRGRGPKEFVFRFELSGYPNEAPAATPWDLERGDVLGREDRPKGERVGPAFNADWKGGQALYLPCDRAALAEHPEWRNKHPRWAWRPEAGITLYLRLLHELLNEEDYVGV